MGRHRRSAAGRAAEGRAAEGRATEVTHPTGSASAPGSEGPQDPYPQDPYAQRAYAQDQHAQDSYARGSYAQVPYTRDPYAQDSYAQDSYVREPYVRDPYALELYRGAPNVPELYARDSYAMEPYNSYAMEPYRGDRAPRGIAPYLNPEAYADTNAKAHAYLFAADDGPGPGGNGFAAGGDSPRRRRRKKAARPVRAGLLGVTAAVALGTTAVATGMVPGLAHYRLGGSTDTTGSEQVQPVDPPGNTATEQGGASGSADSPGGIPAAGAESSSPSASASASPTPTASKTASQQPTPTATASKPTATPSRTAARKPSTAPVAVPAQAAAEAEVLKLVNEERAKVGCSALSANSSLAKLAEAFSADMAARGFFDHTDPDGKSPWDRADAAGITDLGGENIARGQADAAAVMQAWMNSPGHKANILNCNFKTLGVGVHFGSGGPWWTQDFGY